MNYFKIKENKFSILILVFKKVFFFFIVTLKSNKEDAVIGES